MDPASDDDVRSGEIGISHGVTDGFAIARPVNNDFEIDIHLDVVLGARKALNMVSVERLRICCCSAVPLEVVAEMAGLSWLVALLASGSNSFSPLLRMMGLDVDGLEKHYNGTKGLEDLVHVLDFCPIQPLILCFFIIIDILLRIARCPIFNVHNKLLRRRRVWLIRVHNLHLSQVACLYKPC